MKKALLFLVLAVAAFAQNVNVQKAADGTNNITANLAFGSGRTLTFRSGSTLDLQSGAVVNWPGAFIPWSAVNKTGASLADLPTRLFSDLQSKPTTLAGYGVTNGAYLDSVGAANSPYIGFDLAGGTGGIGRLTWNPTFETLDLGLNSQVALQVGQEQVVRILNTTGSTLTDGQLVYISGAQGQRPTVTLAQANTTTSSDRTIGMVTQSIANNAQGFVTVSGIVNNVNTSGLADGTLLWLSATTPGGYTATQPSSPNHSVVVGYVVNGGSVGGGSIFVSVRTGWALIDLHDVSITSPVNNQSLVYDSTLGAWKNQNVSLTAGVSGVLPATSGGTGQSAFALGDTLYASGPSTLATLAGNTTATKKFLSQTGTGTVSAAPAWSTVSASDIDLVGTNGLVARTAANTYAPRTLTGTAGQITVTNGDGVAGNPTISLPSTITQATTFSQAVTLSGALNFGTTQSLFAASNDALVYASTDAGGYGSLISRATSFPQSNWERTGGAVGSKNWLFRVNSDTQASFCSANDGYSTINPFVTYTRSGVTPTNVAFNPTTAATSTTTGSATFGGGVGVAGAGWFGNQVNSQSTGFNAAFVARNTTATTGRTYSFGSNDSGLAYIRDGTAAADRLTIDSTGLVAAKTNLVVGAAALIGTEAFRAYIGSRDGLGTTTIARLTSDAKTNGDGVSLALGMFASDGTTHRSYASLTGVITDVLAGMGALDLNTVQSGTVSRVARATSGGNFLVGGTTDISGSGGLKTFGTTDATTGGAGSLTTAGGIYAAKKIISSTTMQGVGGYIGTATNDNADAGEIGEYVSSSVAVGSAVSLTVATPANVTSISLAAGDWDVSGTVNYVIDAPNGGCTGKASISSTSATQSTDGSEAYGESLLGLNYSIPLTRKRFSLSSTTTVYLVGEAPIAAAGAAGVKAYGTITARRVR